MEKKGSKKRWSEGDDKRIEARGGVNHGNYRWHSTSLTSSLSRQSQRHEGVSPLVASGSRISVQRTPPAHTYPLLPASGTRELHWQWGHFDRQFCNAHTLTNKQTNKYIHACAPHKYTNTQTLTHIYRCVPHVRLFLKQGGFSHRSYRNKSYNRWGL